MGINGISIPARVAVDNVTISSQNNVLSVKDGGITNIKINDNAGIYESKIAFNTISGHNHDGVNSRTLAGTANFLGIDYYGTDFSGTYYTYTPITGATKVLVMVYYKYNAITTTASGDLIRISKGATYPGTLIESSYLEQGDNDRLRHHTIFAYVPLLSGDKIYVEANNGANHSTTALLCVFLNFA